MEAGIDRKRGAHDIFTNKYELEYFPAPGGGKKPFALICPGGGYRFVMSCIEGEPYARALNEKGYTAFVLRYRTRKKGRFPAPQQDIARGVREILENAEKYEVQKEGYSVWGSSAGGHLAAGFGTKEYGYLHFGLPKPGVLILCYTVITMGKQTHPGSADNLLGKKAPAEERRRLSLEYWVTENYPPTFLWNSEADELVPPVNSELLAKALRDNGIPHEYVRYKTGAHGIGLGTGTECEGWFELAVAFWEQNRKQMG